MALLEMMNVSYGYSDGNRRVEVLNSVNVGFDKGKFYTILGPSGSGKTTALSLLGALESPKKGQILFNGEDIRKKGFTKYRKNNCALIFQNYNLINYLTALENVVMAMEVSNAPKADRVSKAMKYLNDVGLTEEEAKSRVNKLSGGQQQRVAIARALAKDADIILADEPTGNLDPKTAGDIVSIFEKLAHTYDKCVIVVSHSHAVGRAADVCYNLQMGEMEKVEFAS